MTRAELIIELTKVQNLAKNADRDIMTIAFMMDNQQLAAHIENNIHAIYLDWVNNYLSTGKMAADYGLQVDTIGDLIDRGRMIHENRNMVSA